MANFGNVFQNTPVKKPDVHPRKDIKWIHYTKLQKSPYQYRDKIEKERRRENILSLALLIEADCGVIDPLLVRKIDADEYEIIGGHTRRDACKYLVEEEAKKQYEFLPCIVEKLGDVHAEWQVLSSNGYQEKTDYEKMYEIQRMKELLEQYPEEFPNLQGGRMVERLAKQLNMKRTTVGEYLQISNNLTPKGKEEFRKGTLNKSAAVELAALPQKEQDELIDQGVTRQKEIQKYKEDREPDSSEIQKFYDTYIREKGIERSELKNWLVERMGKSHSGGCNSELTYKCNPKGICIGNSAEITWARFVKLINLLCPEQEYKSKSDMGNVPEENVPKSGTYNPEENVPKSGTNNLEENVPKSGTNNLEENVPKSGTNNLEEKSSYTPQYFLEEQREKLEMIMNQMEKGKVVPEIIVERQRVIVSALECLVGAGHQ